MSWFKPGSRICLPPSHFCDGGALLVMMGLFRDSVRPFRRPSPTNRSVLYADLAMYAMVIDCAFLERARRELVPSYRVVLPACRRRRRGYWELHVKSGWTRRLRLRAVLARRLSDWAIIRHTSPVTRRICSFDARDQYYIVMTYNSVWTLYLNALRVDCIFKHFPLLVNRPFNDSKSAVCRSTECCMMPVIFLKPVVSACQFESIWRKDRY